MYYMHIVYILCEERKNMKVLNNFCLPPAAAAAFLPIYTQKSDDVAQSIWKREWETR